MKQPLESHRPNLFLLGFITALCSVLVAFEWKTAVEAPLQQFVGLEEFEIIEADLIQPKVAERTPVNERPRTQKSNSIVVSTPSTRRSPAMAGLRPRITSSGPLNNRTVTTAHLPKSNSDVMNVSALSNAEMPYFLDCAEVSDVDERFACTQRYLKQSLVSNLELPDKSVVNELPGKVRVFFIVDEFGQVVDVSIDRSIHPALEEAIDIAFKELPIMMPGGQGNRKVKVRFVQPLDLVRIP